MMLSSAVWVSACLSPPLRGTMHGRVECNPNAFAPLHNAVCRADVARAVVYPENEADVAEVLRYSRENNVTVSYRGGGHSYTCKSMIRDSIQMDMRHFDQVVVDETRNRVTLGAGVIFSEVLRKISPRRYTIAHGGCHSVGVAGYYLHGGIHAPATRLIGLGNETVVAMRVVVGGVQRRRERCVRIHL